MTTNRILHQLHDRCGMLANRYPNAARWLAARLTTDQFSGLPLTVLSGLLLANVLILSKVAENFINAEPMVQADHWFTKTLFQTRSGRLSSFFYLVPGSVPGKLRLVLPCWGQRF